jgi:hypothetical protein
MSEWRAANWQWQDYQRGQSQVASRSIYSPRSSSKKWKLFSLKQKGTTSHLASHDTQIRNVYMNSDQAIPTTFLDKMTVDTVVEFLNALHTALQEEDSVLYFEGCKGVVQTLTLIMTLCPKDVLVLVENEIVHKEEPFGDAEGMSISEKIRVRWTHFIWRWQTHRPWRRAWYGQSNGKGNI